MATLRILPLPPRPPSPAVFQPSRRPTRPLQCILSAGSVSTEAPPQPFAAPGVSDAVMGFVTGRRKATEVAHAVWQHVVRKGDVVVDATCGNGNDTLAMLQMVVDISGKGHVYGMDIQESAISNTLSLLETSLNGDELAQVNLFTVCHSKMEEIVPSNLCVRLVAFNLGYLPGGDKSIITRPPSTLMALQGARKIVTSEGLISIVVYVGHSGGREEYEAVQSFASSLPAEAWVSCKFEMLNRPTAPVLFLFYKK